MTEVAEATPAECVKIVKGYIDMALSELERAEPSHTLDHVRTYLASACVWLPELRDEPKHTARPPHPNTQIGRK